MIPSRSHFRALALLWLLLAVLPLPLFASQPKRKLRVLVTAPAIAYSHITYQGKLADALAAAGHYVHFVIHELRPIIVDGARLARVTHVQTGVGQRESAALGSIMGTLFNNKTVYGSAVMQQFADSMGDMCREVMQNETYHRMLVEEQFDVAIGEEHDVCTFALFQKVGIQAMLLSTPSPTFDEMEYLLGIPVPRSSTNYIFNGYLITPPFTFWQRLWLNVEFYERIWFEMRIAQATQLVLDELYGVGSYDMRRLLRSVCFVLSGSHELVDVPRPTSAKIVQIGGIAVPPPKPLSKEIEQVFAQAKQGVVLFSWGSQIDLAQIPRNLQLNLFNAVARFPDVSFIVRYTRNESGVPDFIDNYPNLHPFAWVHQTSILNHPKTLAFITHGGRNSLNEAVTAGVPTVAVPFFADQHGNSAIYNYRGIGVAMELKELTEDRFAAALKKVIYDPTVRRKAHTLKAKLKASPFPSNERFLRAVEFAAEFKDLSDLDLPGASLPFIVAHNLDVYAFLFTVVVSVVAGVAVVLRCVVRRVAAQCTQSGGRAPETKVHSE